MLNHIVFPLVVISGLISVISCADCVISIRCYGLDPDGNEGYLSVNYKKVATWASTGTDLTTGDAWHLFSIIDESCEVADETHFASTTTDGNDYLDNIYDFLVAQPSGAYVMGCSAGGIDPEGADTALRIESQNLFRNLGVNLNQTSSESTGALSPVLTSTSGLLFLAQKGFPENTIWEIVDSTGAAQAALTGDGAAIISATIRVDWACGIPPMMGPEVFEYVNDSSTNTGQRHTTIVTNSPVSCDSQTVRGWEYIPNVDNTDEAETYFGFVSQGNGGTYSLVDETKIDTAGASGTRHFACVNTPYSVSSGDFYGMWYDDTSDGISIIRRSYQQYHGKYGFSCGKEIAPGDLNVLEYSSSNSFPITTESSEMGLLAFRPIFDSRFLVNCDCASDSDCQTYDSFMVCNADSKCACADNYMYEIQNYKCIYNSTLLELTTPTITAISVGAGSEAYLIDENREGSVAAGTCFSTNEGSLNPWIVFDLGQAAEIHSVQLTTPTAPVSYVKFRTSNLESLTVVNNVDDLSSLSVNIPQSSSLSYDVKGPFTWAFFSSSNYEGTFTTFSGTDQLMFQYLSLRIIEELGLFTTTYQGADYCLQLSSTTFILSESCTTKFFVLNDRLGIVDNSEGEAYLSGTAATTTRVTILNNAGISLETTIGDGFISLADLLDSTTDTAFYSADNSALCLAVDSDRYLLWTDLASDCQHFTLEPDVNSREMLWEVQEYQLDGDNYCDNDISIFVEGYILPPCVQVLDYTPIGSEGEPFFTDVTTDGAYFMNHDPTIGYGYDSCKDYSGSVLYSAQEMGLSYFHIGLSNVFDGLTVDDFDTLCASYQGNTQNGESFTINCTDVYTARYVAIYTDNAIDYEQIHLCDVQIFGKLSDPCEVDNGCCNHNCIPGALSSKYCECYDGFSLNSDGCTCEDINECLSQDSNVCSNDDLATCNNLSPGFECVCPDSVDDVVVFDYVANECHVPQAQRNAGLSNNLCSYENGGCEETCNPGDTVLEFTCSCPEFKELQNDGTSCADLDECSDDSYNNCDDDINGLASCENEIDTGYTCTCNNTDQGVFWDDEKCTTGRDPDNICETDPSLCGEICLPFTSTDPTPVSDILNYTCSCPDGYELQPDEVNCDNINECDNSPCPVGSTCTDNPGSYECTCNTGFELSSNGLSCDNIDECETNNGNCASICTDNTGSFVCSCELGFLINGDGFSCDDIDECVLGTDNCNQTCINTVGSFMCECGLGFTEATEDGECPDLDECATDNGNCDQICDNTYGSYECSCQEGYTLNGRLCENIDECADDALNDCSQICTDLDPLDSNGDLYECSCNDGYTLGNDGTTCSDIDECLNNPCISATSDPATCANTVGGFTCTCPSGQTLLNDGVTCDLTDECASEATNDCTQLCINTISGYECDCNDGYQLDNDGFTCSDVDECLNNPCEQLCTNNIGSYVCSCQNGYVQSTTNPDECDDFDECQSPDDNVCFDGYCVNQEGTYICECPESYELASDLRTCNVIQIQLQASFDYDFDSISNLTAATSQVEEQVCASAIAAATQSVASCEVTSLSAGSVIVDYIILFDDPLETASVAVNPVNLRIALEATPLLIEDSQALLTGTFTQLFVDESGTSIVIPIESDACVLYESIDYCKNGSTCQKDDNDMPYCECADGFTGDQCDVILVIPGEEDRQTSGSDDDLTGLDVILISVFGTLLIVMLAVFIFYCVYRCNGGDDGDTRPLSYRGRPGEIYSDYTYNMDRRRRSLPRGRYPASSVGGEYGRRPASYYVPPPTTAPRRGGYVPPVAPTAPPLGRSPTAGRPWWSNMGASAAAAPPGNQGYQTASRNIYAPPPPRRNVTEYVVDEDRDTRLSYWPTMRAYGMARRYNGGFGGASIVSESDSGSEYTSHSRPYSWRSRYYQ